MAQFSVTTGKQALSATSTKSLILLNPVTNRFVFTFIDISLDAAAAGNGLQIDLYRVSTLGSPAGAAGTVNQIDETTQAATTTALIAPFTTEPTTKVIMDSWFVQPLGGLLVIQYPLNREPVGKAAGNRWGVQYTTTAGSGTPDILATVWFEE